MSPVLLQEETGVPGENLRCFVESKWTTLFSRVTKITFNQITARSRNRTQVTVVRDTCTTTVPLTPQDGTPRGLEIVFLRYELDIRATIMTRNISKLPYA